MDNTIKTSYLEIAKRFKKGETKLRNIDEENEVLEFEFPITDDETKEKQVAITSISFKDLGEIKVNNAELSEISDVKSFVESKFQKDRKSKSKK